jgi:uncharacterized protein (DUF488 family)
MLEPMILTIGHSSHPADRLVGLLKMHDVTELVDIRSAPYSQISPELSGRALSISLPDAGIGYVFRGNELGGRSKLAADYDDTGRVQYDRMARSDEFAEAIEHVLKDAGEQQVALMCAEGDPLECHRTLLVGRALEARGASISHIHPDGTVESSEEAMSRLLQLLGAQENTLFDTREEVIARACAAQARRVAWQDPRMRLISADLP